MLVGLNLSYRRQDQLIFKNVNFSLQSGGALLLHGPNGSGKSTLLQVICGLLEPTQGSVLWDSLPIASHRGAVHLLHHVDGLKGSLTVLENLMFWASLYKASFAKESTDSVWHLQKRVDFTLEENSSGGVGQKQHLDVGQVQAQKNKEAILSSKQLLEVRTREVLEVLELTELAYVPVKHLSLGQRKRVSFAKLLLIKAPLWVLDEPIIALDQKSISLLETLVDYHRFLGGVVIVASHTNFKLENATSVYLS